MRWVVAAVGLVVTLVAVATIAGQATSGAQPWSSELSDNFLLARSIPFALGLGVVAGLLRGRSRRGERRADGAVRRFSAWTVAMHWITAFGVLLALPTGVWQYLGGLLDVPGPLPIPLYMYYRIHYVGALIILFAVAAFITAWWSTGERGLLIRRGEWAASLRGLAYELGHPVGPALARLLRLDLRPRPPERGAFSFYEKVVSFPTWSFAIGLITLTGVVKALRYVYPVPGPVLYWSSTLHVAAMVMILLKTLDHLRYTLADWPLMVAMATGWLPPRRPRPPEPTTASAASPSGIGGEA